MNYGENNRTYRTRAQHGLGRTLLQAIPSDITTILDVGCGMGEFSDIMENLGYDVFRVDGADHCVRYNHEKGHKCDQIDFEFGTLPFATNMFDAAVSLDVIEHLWNTDHYLSEIQRVVKPNGYIILSTPNYNYLRYRILCSIGKFESFTYKSRHKKFYTVNSFKNTVESRANAVKIVGTFAGIKQIDHGLNLFAGQIGILGQFL